MGGNEQLFISSAKKILFNILNEQLFTLKGDTHDSTDEMDFLHDKNESYVIVLVDEI